MQLWGPAGQTEEAAAPSCETLTLLGKVLRLWSLVWPEAMQMELEEGAGVSRRFQVQRSKVWKQNMETVKAPSLPGMLRGFQSCLQGGRLAGEGFAILDIMR